MVEEDSIRTQIVNIYAVHNPEKLEMIDALLGEWRGEEEELLANIKEKCVRETLFLGQCDRVLSFGAVFVRSLLDLLELVELLYFSLERCDHGCHFAGAGTYRRRNGATPAVAVAVQTNGDCRMCRSKSGWLRNQGKSGE